MTLLEAIKERLDYSPRDLPLLEKILIEAQGVSGLELAKKLSISKSAFYRHAENLERVNLLKHEHGLYQTIIPTAIRRDFYIPAAIQQGILHEHSGNATNLATLLAHLPDNSKLPGNDLTKAQILAHIKRELDNNPELRAKLILNLQNLLAIMSLYKGDLKPFENMSGASPVIPNIEEVLHV